MKKFLFSIFSIGFATASFAQLTSVDSVVDGQKVDASFADTVAWTRNATINIGGIQSALYNWQPGGELSSLMINARLDANLNRYYHRHIWSNNLVMEYGSQANYSTGFSFRKTTDRIDYTSKYGYKLKPGGNWYLSGLLNARTQIAKGYLNYDMDNYKMYDNSKFLSPLYVLLSPGIEYRKGEKFSVFFSPIAARMTFVSRHYTSQSETGAFGVKYNETSRFELGAFLSARYSNTIAKNLQYKSRLDLYSNYLAKDTKDALGNVIKKDNPGNIDIMFDNMLTYSFMKYFNVSFALTMIYDNDVPYKTQYDANNNPIKEPLGNLGWWQVRQGFTVGFIYSFK